MVPAAVHLPCQRESRVHGVFTLWVPAYAGSDTLWIPGCAGM